MWMKFYSNTAIGQWRGCTFVQIGSLCLVLWPLPGERSWGLEVCTPMRWFALRPFRRLIWRRTP